MSKHTLGGDFQAFSPLPVIRYHYTALRPPGATRISRGARILLFWLPCVAGAGMGVAVACGMRLVDGVSQVLAATALLIGAMLSAFIFLTNLRIKVSESATYAFRASLQKLIGGAAVGCLYVAGVALGSAGMLAAVATIEFLRNDFFRPVMGSPAGGDPPAPARESVVRRAPPVCDVHRHLRVGFHPGKPPSTDLYRTNSTA